MFYVRENKVAVRHAAAEMQYRAWGCSESNQPALYLSVAIIPSTTQA